MITLSRPINWAYYYYGWRNSGLSFLAFYERVFEQAYPPISNLKVVQNRHDTQVKMTF